MFTAHLLFLLNGIKLRAQKITTKLLDEHEGINKRLQFFVIYIIRIITDPFLFLYVHTERITWAKYYVTGFNIHHM